MFVLARSESVDKPKHCIGRQVPYICCKGGSAQCHAGVASPFIALAGCGKPECGAGAFCRQLRGAARAIAGKSQLFINAYARALEVIPRQLCDNAGFDATDVLNRLRMTHALQDGSGKHYGVDINSGRHHLPLPARSSSGSGLPPPSASLVGCCRYSWSRCGPGCHGRGEQAWSAVLQPLMRSCSTCSVWGGLPVVSVPHRQCRQSM